MWALARALTRARALVAHFLSVVGIGVGSGSGGCGASFVVRVPSVVSSGAGVVDSCSSWVVGINSCVGGGLE